MVSPRSRRVKLESSVKTLAIKKALELHRLLARERHQLAHQGGPSIGLLFDLHDIEERLLSWPITLQEEIADTDHRG